ncbi:hypothetical protein [Priestia megaterium]|jgi:hypothetical protein|nr:hypothetical protein [Priestia megaterium]MDH3142454.1 hypothetical protein [Priestia megaterium]MED4235806.1 hypothetical protein [Priestia megaterium]MED4255182.1 hypothetical protein [Priestia megaterium]MED4265471.1 hypothetical protein [Priestia megaterium]MED4274795.1 hypothetical protein [Priestia megaterium]
MAINKEVLYQDKIFKIIHIYDSGYCEIREIRDRFAVKLVLLNDLIMLN